jgi:hypothetical protein
MRITNIKVNKKKDTIRATVYVSKEERKVIRDYYGRKRCTGKLVQKAVTEGLENYIEEEATKNEKTR